MAWQGTTALTPDAWARVEPAATAILALGVGERADRTPEDIPEGIAEFADLWRVLFRGVPCTPQSVSQRWGWFLAGDMHGAAAAAEIDQQRRDRTRRRMEAMGR